MGAKVELDLAQQRRQAHVLLDTLPGQKLSAVYSLLEVLAEPLDSYLASVSFEDEELTPEMIATLEEANASLSRGERCSHESTVQEVQDRA
jgi:hypothetical protein